MPNPAAAPAWVPTPQVGGDFNAWGGELNAILTTLAVDNVISVAVSIPLAFGTANIRTVVLATGGVGGITITLPNAAQGTGKVFVVKKTDAGIGAVTVASAGGTIDGATTYLLTTQNQRVQLVSDGTNWWIV